MLFSQDLTGASYFLVRIQNYHNRQSIIIREGELII